MSEQAKPSTLPAREPFSALRHEIDRVFSDFSRGFRMPDVFSGAGADIFPNMDVQETDKRVTLAVELPGVDPKDVNVETIGDTVMISGEKKSEFERKNGESYRRERSYGSFERRLTLPFSIDEKAVDAKFDKGVLTITIDKPADAVKASKKITVKS
jgi:HSP20 family protein